MTDTFEVVWPAPYCPELNDIERTWNYVKGSAMANHDFGGVEDMREAVDAAFEELGLVQIRKLGSSGVLVIRYD